MPVKDYYIAEILIWMTIVLIADNNYLEKYNMYYKSKHS